MRGYICVTCRTQYAPELEDLYVFTWVRNIIGDARASVDRSLEQYLAAIAPAERAAGRLP